MFDTISNWIKIGSVNYGKPSVQINVEDSKLSGATVSE